jgi:hypothetical protein
MTQQLFDVCKPLPYGIEMYAQAPGGGLCILVAVEITQQRGG